MTFDDLRRALFSEVGSEAAFAFVNTRLILRTGVNLKEKQGTIAPDNLEHMLREIRAMGFLKGKDVR
jgi:hypothetical protein